MPSRLAPLALLSMSFMLLCVFAVIPVAGVPNLQLNPTDQQSTVDAIVSERMMATAEQRQSSATPNPTQTLTPIPTLTLMPTATFETSISVFESNSVSNSIVMDVGIDAFEHYLEGWEQYWRDDFNDAEDEFSEAIELEPEWSEAYLARAINYFSTGDVDSAYDDINMAESLLGYADAGVASWSIYLDVEFDEIEDAIDDGELILSEMPDNAVGLYYLALAYLLDEDYEAALDSLDVLFRYSPSDQLSHELRSIIYDELGQNDDRRYSERVAEGLEAANNNDLDEAIDLLEEALEDVEDTSNPDFNTAIANWNLALIQYFEGSERRALRALDDAAEAYPEMGSIYYLRSIVLDISVSDAVYLETLTTGITIDPEFPDTYISRGAHYERNGDEELALADHWQYLQLKQAHSLFWQSIDPLDDELRLPFLNGWEHRFVVEAEEGDRLSVTAVESGIGESYVDPLIVVLAPDGTPIASGDDMNAFTLDAEISRLHLPENGTYTIVIGVGPSGNSGIVELEVELD